MYHYHSDEAFRAAYRLVNACEAAGVNLSDPNGIACGLYDEYLPDDMSYNSGASRVVIWDEYCDFVLKLPLSEYYEKYCQKEVDVYNDAEDAGLADHFAWCGCYGEPTICDDYYNPGIYVMEYIYCNEEDVYDSAWKYGYETYCKERGLDSSNYDAADDYNDWNYGEEDDMVLDCIEAHMDNGTRRAFNVFMMKWCINDIHTANAGICDGRLVLVDYAGWNW